VGEETASVRARKGPSALQFLLGRKIQFRGVLGEQDFEMLFNALKASFTMRCQQLTLTNDFIVEKTPARHHFGKAPASAAQAPGGILRNPRNNGFEPIVEASIP
jgi:hypothetical protein